MRRRAWTIVVVALWTAGPSSSAGRAQPAPDATGSVVGTVVDARTSAPLSGVLVERQGSGQHVLTDEAGAFALRAIPAGRHALYVSVIGYALARPSVEVSAGEETSIVVPLSEGTGAYTEHVTVSSGTPRVASLMAPASQTLTSAALQDLRGVLADDPFRAVQALPGVAAGDDFRSEFSVRGSDFAHVGLSIDGVASRWLVHSVLGVEDTGSISLINGDVLDRVTLMAGVYPQRFGGRTGAWLDASIREGSRDARAVRGALSGTGASIVAEGPVGSRRAGSWLVSVRQSYLDWLLRRVAGDSDTVFGFTDAQAKVAYDASPRQHVELTLVVGRSRLDEKNADPGPNSLGTGKSRTMLLTAGWRSMLGSSWVVNQRVAVVAGGFRNRGFFSQDLADGRFSDASYAAETTWAPTAALLVDAGARVARETGAQASRQFSSAPAGGQVIERTRTAFSGAAWRESVQMGLLWTSPGGVSLNPGVLALHHHATGETLVAPWLTVHWPLAPRFALRGGTGLSQQVPELEQLLGPAGNQALGSERATQADVAADVRLRPSTVITIGGYVRRERDVLRREGAELQLAGNRLVFSQSPARYHNALQGSARGLELIVRHASRRAVSGWVSYSFGRLRYDDRITGESYWGDFDQRHGVNAYVHYRLSPRTSLSAKLRTSSNFPVAGYLVEQGDRLVVGDRRNLVRLSPYARFDLRANRTFNYSRRRLTLFVEALNVLGRTNYGPSDGAIRTRTGEAVGYVETLLPFLPSAGLTVEF